MKFIFILTVTLLFRGVAVAQIPVEIFAGDKRSTLDIMFFKFFKNKTNENSKFLLFNRNRASIDYRMTKSEYLPQIGFTEAVSYNHPNLKGFAPVLVGQVLSRGVYPKAGVQYVYLSEKLTLFSWLVSEILTNPVIDYFILIRYTPAIFDAVKLYTQFECISTFPTLSTVNYNFAQRFRLGLKLKQFQFGVGADLNQTGKKVFIQSINTGGFVRYEF